MKCRNDKKHHGIVPIQPFSGAIMSHPRKIFTPPLSVCATKCGLKVSSKCSGCWVTAGTSRIRGKLPQSEEFWGKVKIFTTLGKWWAPFLFFISGGGSDRTRISFEESKESQRETGRALISFSLTKVRKGSPVVVFPTLILKLFSSSIGIGKPIQH